MSCCRPWWASSGISPPALLPSSSNAREEAPKSSLGMVRLVEVVLKPGKRASAHPGSPPLATQAGASRLRCATHPPPRPSRGGVPGAFATCFNVRLGFCLLSRFSLIITVLS